MIALRRIVRATIELASCLALLCAGGARAAPRSIEVVTEEVPGAQYTENGQLTGMTTEVVKAALEEAKLTGTFRALPWARALHYVQTGDSVLIYPLARTEEREAHFKWVGMIDSARNFIYAMKGSVPKLERLDDAKTYVIGTVIGDVREAYFKRHGFELGKNLVSVPSHDLNYNKLKAQRIALWPMSEWVMTYVVRKAGDDPSRLVAVWELRDLSTYPGDFMAFGLNTPDELVETLKSGFERVKRDGRLDAIQAKWMR